MTCKTRAKSAARALQTETGWSYSECLRLVRIAAEGGETVDAVLAREGRTRTGKAVER